MRSLRELTAGDEKLFHFKGNTVYLIHVLSKPGKIGFLIYQLRATLGKRGSEAFCDFERAAGKI